MSLDLNNYSDKEFLTIGEIQQVLRIGRDKARKLVKAKDFPALKIGASVRIPKDEFIKWYKTYSYK